MKLTINEFYDDENGEFIAIKYYINSEECGEDEYYEMLETLDEINETKDNVEDKCDGNCAECPNNRFEQEPEENKFLRAVTDAVNDTLEMFDDPNTCDDCKAQALLSLVMLGADGALQGRVGRKEDLN